MVKRTFKSKHRRVYTKRRPRKNAVTTRVRYARGLYKAGVSQSQMMKLRFVLTPINVNASTSTFVSTQYRLNSPYDPTYAIGGGQPKWYDEMALMYKNYIVYGCKVTLRGSTDTANLSTAIVAMWLTDSPISTTIADGLSKGDTTYRLIDNDKSMFSMSRYYSMPRTLGMSRNQYNNSSQTWSTTNANPALQKLVNIGVASWNGASTCAVSYAIDMTYYVKFYNRQNVNDQ